ncbi:flagellar hook protein FlgE [Geodermatophilus sp. DSM 44513]|uniref:flagellar hook protein FlgE n=1 Tax=Geodermatophilus sp. DSM 44513 TaxID=1528104 RepID=UPI00127A48F0|nr:flagellar hook protein FlgE [Geodermatophilus sp. DSM 44513]WNV76459.1 flagellar hook protein FlgE [Geodermatophilus sp. DSM 44513]
MLRSMNSAISGLRAHQTKLDVTGNNIANVNTVGFKASQTVFEDTLSQAVRNGSAPRAEVGGTNPAQVGLGVKVAGITTNFGQGSTQNTGRSTDFMIEGDGFFVVQTGAQQLYTRAGSFNFDAAGNLVTPSGAKLQGWAADATGVVNTNGPIGALSVPAGQTIAPRATTTGVVAGNLPADATPATTTPPAPATTIETPLTVFDDLGNEVPVTFTFTKTGAVGDGAWNVVAAIPNPAFDPTAPVSPTNQPRTPVNGATGQDITFDAATGRLTATSIDELALTIDGRAVAIDISTMTQYGSPGTVTAPEQDGYAAGTLESFALGNDGTITGSFSNGERQTLGRLAMASFANPGGLEKAGGSTFRAANNSGVPNIGEAGTGGRGSLVAGALEMSNVDLAEEFTGLIVAQRGFQANSRVITSSDEVLQDLVNLKR